MEAAFPEEVPAAEAEEAGSLLSAFFIIDFSQLSTQSVRNIKPPAMRVRKRKFATKYTFHYNRVVQATINERKVFIWLIKLIACLILNGCVSII